jgi:hypothetical protein
MQTSLDWFLENLPERLKYALLNTCEEGIKKAKQKDKEQIINIYWDAYKEGQISSDVTADEYYNQNYKNNE